MKHSVASLILLLLVFSLKVSAQTVAPAKIKKGNKTLVTIPVAVSDREGRYIAGLKKDDFTVYQNGVEQDIDFFSTDSEPLTVALLIDTSGSTSGVLKEIKDAAKDFVDLLNENDQCLIATFDAEVKIHNSFASDRKTLKKTLDKIQTARQEGSVMLSAVEQTARNSFANVQGRKAIVILSDGKDLGSRLSKNDLTNLLEESDLMIYSIFYQTGKGFNKIVVEPDGKVKEAAQNKQPETKKPKKKKKGYSIVIPLPGDTFSQEDAKLIDKVASVEAVNFLQELSDLTAGKFYQSDAPSLSRIFKQIAGELKQQYRLGFYTREAQAAASDDFNTISVKVQRPDAVVRARGKFRSKQL
jgi:Ca-activated chloride channel homolog